MLFRFSGVVVNICVLLATGNSFASEFRMEQITIHPDGDPSLQASLKIPATEASGTRHPAVLLFGGFEEAAQVLSLVDPGKPVILASFDYPFKPPRNLKFPESLSHASEGKSMCHRTVRGILALRKALAGRADVDANRIIVLGASLGAPFAVNAAALDPAFRAMVIVHGFGDIRGTAIHRLKQVWASKFGWWSGPMAWALATVGWLYLDFKAPEEAARELKAHQQVLMISARDDSFIPRSSTQALLDGIRESPAQSEWIEMPGDHLMPGSTDIIGKILRLTTDWMAKHQLLAESK